MSLEVSLGLCGWFSIMPSHLNANIASVKPGEQTTLERWNGWAADPYGQCQEVSWQGWGPTQPAWEQAQASTEWAPTQADTQWAPTQADTRWAPTQVDSEWAPTHADSELAPIQETSAPASGSPLHHQGNRQGHMCL